MFLGAWVARPRRLRPTGEVAHRPQRDDQLRARALAVRDEARDVAAVDAPAGDEQVVAPAAGDAAQLHLPRRRPSLRARLRRGEREPRVTLDALARGVERVT